MGGKGLPEPDQLRVLMVSSEIAPYAMTGGLGDVVADLPVALHSLGVDVRRVMPKYRVVAQGPWPLKPLFGGLRVQVGPRTEECAAYEHVDPDGLVTYFLEHDGYFDREGLYGTPAGEYADSAERFVLFTRGVLELLKRLEWAPHLIHCHDWQSALLPAYPECRRSADPARALPATILTTHNLGYQGRFGPQVFPATGLGWEEYTAEKLEFYGDWSMLKGGLAYADLLSTVSPQYRKEILTPEFGFGLEGVLRHRRADLFGVLNGIDYRRWNPSTDEHLAAQYGPDTLAQKEKNKLSILRRFGLPEERASRPLLGMVGRLCHQKGMELVAGALDELAALNLSVAILGDGEDYYRTLISRAVERHAGRAGVLFAFDLALARQIFAGADFLLVPSRYEPCGLVQMMALAYGTLTIARRTGGLVNTVVDYDHRPERANGFLFSDYSIEGLVGAVRRALAVCSNKDEWTRLRRRAMATRFTWDVSARRYIKLYQRAVASRLERQHR